MPKSAALNLVFLVSAILCLRGAALNESDSRFSMTCATVQQPSASAAEADFSPQLQGGILIRFGFGLIVVKPTAPPGPPRPTALTTDAIITTSVRTKIVGQSELPPGEFEVKTDDGIVTIRSQVDSLKKAAEVINLALCVSDVREIVYTMPLSVWETGVRRQEFKEFRSSGERHGAARVKS